jgi:hypothetical protein
MPENKAVFPGGFNYLSLMKWVFNKLSILIAFNNSVKTGRWGEDLFRAESGTKVSCNCCRNKH